MRLVALILTTLGLLVAPALAEDPKKPEPKKAEAKKPAVRTEVVVGEVIHVESQKQQIKIKGSPATTRPNPLVIQSINNLKAEVRDVARIRDPKERLAALKDLDDRMRTLSNDLYVYTVDAGAACEVRLPTPKEQFDEMGNIKKLTPRERAKLVGKDRMFEGEWGDLKTRQIVSVTVVKLEPPRPARKGEELPLVAESHEAVKVAVVRDYIEPRRP